MRYGRLLRLASDGFLAEEVRAGSERSFEALFDRYHRPLLGFCRQLLGSRHEAEDAVQQTFLSAYRELRRSEPPAAVKPWLFTIARNRCLSMLRARRERPLDELPEVGSDQLTVAVATRAELRELLGDLARLPEPQRAALVLAELGDLSHAEIAQILDCSRDRVKGLAFEARSALAAHRAARDTPCSEIREQLATLRGGSLRRTTLRRHLQECTGCRAFREQVRFQRRVLGLLLPVMPSIGLKRAVLGATIGTGGGALGGGGIAATVAVLVAVPAGGITVAATGGESAAPDRTSVPPSATVETAATRPAPSPRSGATPARRRQGLPTRSLPGGEAPRPAAALRARAHRAAPTATSIDGPRPASLDDAPAAQPDEHRGSPPVASHSNGQHGATERSQPKSDPPPQSHGHHGAARQRNPKPGPPPHASAKRPDSKPGPAPHAGAKHADPPPHANGQPDPGPPPHANGQPKADTQEETPSKPAAPPGQAKHDDEPKSADRPPKEKAD